MDKKLFFLLFIICLFVCNNCQSQIAFEKSYDVNLSSLVIQNSVLINDGFLLIGSCTNSSLNTKACILKLNQDGSVSKFVTKGADYFYDGCQTSDNNYVLVGGTNSDPNLSYSAEYIAKVDTSLNTIWALERTNSQGYIIKVCPTDDFGIAYAGSVNDNGNDKTHIVKINATGNVQWSCMLGDSLSQYPYDLKQTSDGGFVVVGYTTSIERNIFISKLSASGMLEWSKMYSGTYSIDDVAISVVQNPDSGFTVYGFVNLFDKILFRTDANGNIIWSLQFPGSILPSIIHPTLQTAPNGNYVVEGLLYGASISLFDQSGNALYTTTFGLNNRYDLYSFQQFNDDYLFITYDNGNSYALRTNKANSCSSLNASINPSFGYLNVQSLTSWSAGNDVFASVPDTTVIGAVTVDTLCFIRTNGIEEMDDDQLTIYPNPATENLQLAFSNPAFREITIVNYLGQEIFNVRTMDEKFNLYVSKFAKGIYYCRIKNGNSYTTKRFLKN